MTLQTVTTSQGDAVEAPRPQALIELALGALPAMQLPSGLFCWERRKGDPAPHGRSPRYTLMTLLGLERAAANGYDAGFDLERIHTALWEDVAEAELAPGDHGLYLWLDARTGGGRGPEILERLEAALAAQGGLGAREGMEIGWIVTGLAHHVSAGGEGARPLLGTALDQLLGANRAPSGLFRHHGDPGRRRRFPNFATQIYAVLALATAGGLGLDDRALTAACAAADRLLALQLDDGGWPWLFDAERGRVVERYEVYAVHQDAMAPMGLLELTEATGDRRYADAVARGLGWIAGRNELGAGMVDAEAGLVYRGIRRRAPWNRLCLAANTAAAAALGRSRAGLSRRAELDLTDRPYHFGWVLEAWCGREGILEG